jgi:hypothetical protein
VDRELAKVVMTGPAHKGAKLTMAASKTRTKEHFEWSGVAARLAARQRSTADGGRVPVMKFAPGQICRDLAALLPDFLETVILN